MKFTAVLFLLVLSACASTSYYEKVQSGDGETQYRVTCKDVDDCYAQAYNEICQGPLIVVHTDIRPTAPGPQAPQVKPEFTVLVECGDRKPLGGEIRLDKAPD